MPERTPEEALRLQDEHCSECERQIDARCRKCLRTPYASDPPTWMKGRFATEGCPLRHFPRLDGTPDLTLFFDRISCLTLTDERWTGTIAEMDKWGWPFGAVERFKGIDGNKCELPPGWEKHKERAVGGYGCTMSHLEGMLAAQRDGVKVYLELEDDVKFFPDSSERAEAFIRNLPADWDAFSLGACFNKPPEPTQAPDVYRLLEGWCAQAIAWKVNSPFFQLCVDALQSNAEINDTTMAWMMPKGKVYTPLTPIIDQRAGFSFIDREKRPAGLLRRHPNTLRAIQSVTTFPARRSRVLSQASTDSPFVKNLAYHLWPNEHTGMWRWNVAELTRRWPVFTGRKIIAIATGPGTASVETVRAALPSDSEIIEVANDPTIGEVASFETMLDMLAEPDPKQITFYAHAKGTKYSYDDLARRKVRDWSEMMYASMLDYPDLIDESLRSHPMCGSVLKAHRKSEWGMGVEWHISGTFYWFRHDAIFSRDGWRCVPRRWLGTEVWPALMFPDWSRVDWLVYLGDESSDLIDRRFWDMRFSSIWLNFQKEFAALRRF